MYDIEDLLRGCAHETRVIQHLATKMPAGALAWRPTPGQRSTLELMRYMTRMAAVPMARAVDGDWKRGETLEEEAGSLDPEDFAAQLDRQMEILREEAGKLAGRDLAGESCTMPWGTPCTLGAFLVDAVYKTFTAYRMQFFLYLKAAGATQLGAAQCWAGFDPPAE
jgi:hypothetical protein